MLCVMEQEKGGVKDEETYIREMRGWTKKVLASGVDAIYDQYRRLRQTPEPPGYTFTACEKNRDRNRYNDIQCYDQTRVKLQGTEPDYIHANFVQDNSQSYNEYICTQGPTETTVPVFWQMVWQQRVVAIVMLCQLIETNKDKCSCYWYPVLNHEVKIGPFTVKTKSQTPSAVEDHLIIVSELAVRREKEERLVYHFHHVNWPDRMNPPSAFPILSFIRQIHRLHFRACSLNKLEPRESPIVVHCSAGIGRTGTLVAIDLCYKQLISRVLPDVEATVQRLRNCRHMSVQTIDQYFYIYHTILEYLNRCRIVNCDLTPLINEFHRRFPRNTQN